MSNDMPLHQNVDITAPPAASSAFLELRSTRPKSHVPDSSSADAYAMVRSDHHTVLELAASAAGIGCILVCLDSRTASFDSAAAAQHRLAALDAPDAEAALTLDAWLDLLAEKDQPTLSGLFDAGPTGASAERVSVRLPGRAGQKVRLLELSFIPVQGARQLVAASRDVTAERSREELRRQKIAAERASRAKSEFMSQVSHELRTPLNAILGFAQLMAMDITSPLSAAHRQRLQLVEHSGRRLLGLIDQLLLIGSAEHRRRHLRLQDLPTLPIIKRCLDSLEPMAMERNVKFQLDVRAPQAIAWADEQALEQVVTNLLTNAIKYNKDRGRVRVRLELDSDVVVTIDDTGRGMSDEQLGQLFEPFNRLSVSRSSIQGTGLGLVITKQFVEALDGKLTVWSRPNKGSRFQVRLPSGNSESAVAPATGSTVIPSQWNTGMRCEVLYVEDDEVNVLLMEELFRTQPDWQLTVARTADEGIARAKAMSPDLVLVDMNLPDGDGLTVLRALQTDPRTNMVKCVVVSADAVPQHVALALRAGFADYWTKPLVFCPANNWH